MMKSTYERRDYVDGIEPGTHYWHNWKDAIDHPQWVWGQYFHPSEFKSERDPMPELKLSHKAMSRLYALRVAWKKPIVINSAYRSPAYNKEVGGASNSLHMQGRAFDVAFPGDYRKDQMIANRMKFILLAHAYDFHGFGWYEHFIHIDTGGFRTWND